MRLTVSRAKRHSRRSEEGREASNEQTHIIRDFPYTGFPVTRDFPFIRDFPLQGISLDRGFPLIDQASLRQRLNGYFAEWVNESFSRQQFDEACLYAREGILAFANPNAEHVLPSMEELKFEGRAMLAGSNRLLDHAQVGFPQLT